MTSSVSEAPPRERYHRLLGHPADFAGHIETHGQLAVALNGHPSWQHALISSIEASGLTGRGGGDFPTSIKLNLASSQHRGGTIVVNGMEGEPASDKDKVLLTRSPHLVLDGAQFLAAACRAARVVVCVPVGSDVVAAAVSHAIVERSQTNYPRVVETVERPPDRFVAGEESALVNFIESGRSLPMFRSDKSIPLCIGKRQALVHNTETLAHIALIARQGPEPFRSRGLAEEPGTCLVTIGGALAHPGVVEVDRGTPLWEIVARGTPNGGAQAILVGGYGGTWVGPDHFGTPYASIPLRTVGASAGVGVLHVLGHGSCGIAESARIARYLADQSSGQCGPCVYGLPAIADDLALLATGRADTGLMSRLDRRLREVDGRGGCRHPDGAVRMIRSCLGVFACDVATHSAGRPCVHAGQPSTLRLPRPKAL
jgi:NADH:ubiquinone oxidoreductase subunit F (NADH-binding)